MSRIKRLREERAARFQNVSDLYATTWVDEVDKNDESTVTKEGWAFYSLSRDMFVTGDKKKPFADKTKWLFETKDIEHDLTAALELVKERVPDEEFDLQDFIIVYTVVYSRVTGLFTRHSMMETDFTKAYDYRQFIQDISFT